MRIKIILCSMLFIVFSAHASMVGQHIDVISKQTGIVYQLSDTKCKDDSYRVLISTANIHNFPVASPYGDGCWTIASSKIHIVGKSFDEKIPIKISFDVDLFKFNNQKIDWSKFATRRDEKSIESNKKSSTSECKILYQSWIFNRLLEEGCSFNKGVAIKIGSAAKQLCPSLTQNQRNIWGKEVMVDIKNDIDKIGNKEFCLRNKASYEELVQ